MSLLPRCIAGWGTTETTIVSPVCVTTWADACTSGWHGPFLPQAPHVLQKAEVSGHLLHGGAGFVVSNEETTGVDFVSNNTSDVDGILAYGIGSESNIYYGTCLCIMEYSGIVVVVVLVAVAVASAGRDGQNGNKGWSC